MENAPRTTDNCPSVGLPFDQSTSVSDIMAHWPQTVPVFLSYQMLCVGCYVGPFHSISVACFEHDIDEQRLLQDLTIAMGTPP